MKDGLRVLDTKRVCVYLALHDDILKHMAEFCINRRMSGPWSKAQGLV
jgi:hypothetical protein